MYSGTIANPIEHLLHESYLPCVTQMEQLFASHILHWKRGDMRSLYFLVGSLRINYKESVCCILTRPTKLWFVAKYCLLHSLFNKQYAQQQRIFPRYFYLLNLFLQHCNV